MDWLPPIIAAIAIKTNVPTLFIGPPGTGKTCMVEAIGRQLTPQYTVSPVVLSTMDPADVHGLPVIIDGVLRIAPPTYIQKIQNERYGILFFDEITNSPQSTQAAALRGIYNREFGEIKLHNNIAILGAGNPIDMASDAHDLTPAFANRFAHFKYETQFDIWSKGALSGFENIQLPTITDDWLKFKPHALGLILGFLQRRPDYLIKVPDNEEDRGGAWPSPRSWYDFALPFLAVSLFLQSVVDFQHKLIAGCVGDGIATEFIAWISDANLPHPEDVLKNPLNFNIPERGDVAYAVLTSVVTAILLNNTMDRWFNGWILLKHFANNSLADIAMLSAKILSQNRPKDFDDNRLPIKEINAFMEILKEFEYAR